MEYFYVSSTLKAQTIFFLVYQEALCKIVKTLGIYSSMATIYWMFIEGLVLHKSLYAFNGNSHKWPFVVYQLIGWLLPTIFVGFWIFLQELLQKSSSTTDNGDDDDDGRPHCWQGYGRSNLIYIITIPMMLALGANICFLINIIRILVIKLRNTDATETMPRAIQATAFLIPLLGNSTTMDTCLACTDKGRTSFQLEKYCLSALFALNTDKLTQRKTKLTSANR